MSDEKNHYLASNFFPFVYDRHLLMGLKKLMSFGLKVFLHLFYEAVVVVQDFL